MGTHRNTQVQWETQKQLELVEKGKHIETNRNIYKHIETHRTSRTNKSKSNKQNK